MGLLDLHMGIRPYLHPLKNNGNNHLVTIAIIDIMICAVSAKRAIA